MLVMVWNFDLNNVRFYLYVGTIHFELFIVLLYFQVLLEIVEDLNSKVCTTAVFKLIQWPKKEHLSLELFYVSP